MKTSETLTQIQQNIFNELTVPFPTYENKLEDTLMRELRGTYCNYIVGCENTLKRQFKTFKLSELYNEYIDDYINRHKVFHHFGDENIVIIEVDKLSLTEGLEYFLKDCIRDRQRMKLFASASNFRKTAQKLSNFADFYFQWRVRMTYDGTDFILKKSDEINDFERGIYKQFRTI